MNNLKTLVEKSREKKALDEFIGAVYKKDGEIKFLINNKNYSTFDIKYFILSGYIYIMHKPSFVINNITFIYKKNDVGYIEDNNKGI